MVLTKGFSVHSLEGIKTVLTDRDNFSIRTETIVPLSLFPILVTVFNLYHRTSRTRFD